MANSGDSYYGVLVSRYWTGHTGRLLRTEGGKDAQLLGVYLLSNDYMNMLGLYRLSPVVIVDELGLTRAAIARTFKIMAKANYAQYDESSSFVWVREMARFRLNIPPDDQPLDRKDKRVIGAQTLYEKLPPNPFLAAFFDRYHKVLHLRTRRNGTPPLAHQRGMEGASEGLRSQ